MNKHARGFTIVELLIVIVVIAVLAALSYVAYRNIQDNARKSAAESNLTQAKKQLNLHKAEHGTYPTTNNHAEAGVSEPDNTTYQYSSTNGTTFCLTATNGDTVYRVTESTTPIQGGCPEHTWPGGIAMTNLVTNGDFSQGTAGWSRTASSLVATDGILTATVTTIGGNAAISRGGINILSGREYYISFSMNPFSSHIPAAFIGNFNNLPPLIPANTTTAVSQVVTAGSNGTTLTIRLNRDNTIGMAVGSVAEFSNILLIDLTEAFGPGNEPTKAQMDQLMQQFPDSYFNGTITANTQGIL